jgi:ppGpp synthetase/RelA/SpoT-type nucleotidyltranferase
VSCQVVVPPLKDPRRISLKGRRDYAQRSSGPPCSYVCDVLRASVTAPSEDAILALLEALERQRDLEVLKVKNRFRHPLFTGYRDVLVSVLLEGVHVAEVQVREE